MEPDLEPTVEDVNDDFEGKRYSLATLMKKDFPRTPTIIGGNLLDRGERMLITGEQKVGKSFLTYQMALSAASGLPFLGFHDERCAPRRVLIVNAEVKPPRLQERFRAQLQDYPEWVQNNIQVVFPSSELKIDASTTQKVISNLVRSEAFDLVIFDPMANLITSDENTSQGMGAVTAGIDAIIRATCKDDKIGGCAVILVHHHNKAGRSNPNMGHKARGHSSLSGWYDNHIALSWEKPLAGGKILPREVSFECRNRREPEPIIVDLNTHTTLFSEISATDIEALTYNNATTSKDFLD